MSLARRQTALTFLGLARQADTDPEVAAAYLTALGDVEVEWLEAACRDRAREVRAPFESAMPAVGAILAKAGAWKGRAAIRASRRALPPHPIDRETFGCFQCQDDPDGWLILTCPHTACGRHYEHAAHPFTVRCPHWLRQHEDGIRDGAAERRKKNQPMTPEFLALQDMAAGAYRYERAVTQV